MNWCLFCELVYVAVVWGCLAAFVEEESWHGSPIEDVLLRCVRQEFCKMY